jgi:hypothetical protein
MSEISLGTALNNMKTVTVMWNGFSDAVAPDEVIHKTLSGALDYTAGSSLVVFSGQIEVSDNPAYGTATFANLRSFFKESWIWMTDHKGVSRKVIWASPFQVSWIGKGANLGYMPFTFIELKE